MPLGGGLVATHSFPQPKSKQTIFASDPKLPAYAHGGVSGRWLPSVPGTAQGTAPGMLAYLAEMAVQEFNLQQQKIFCDCFLGGHMGHAGERKYFVGFTGCQEGARELEGIGGYHVVIG